MKWLGNENCSLWRQLNTAYIQYPYVLQRAFQHEALCRGKNRPKSKYLRSMMCAFTHSYTQQQISYMVAWFTEWNCINWRVWFRAPKTYCTSHIRSTRIECNFRVNLLQNIVAWGEFMALCVRVCWEHSNGCRKSNECCFDGRNCIMSLFTESICSSFGLHLSIEHSFSLSLFRYFRFRMIEI